MPRDPFYNSHAAEMAANIATATLQDLGPGLWRNIDHDRTGEVHAETLSGVVYSFRWEVESQELVLTNRYDPQGHRRIIEVELAA